MNGHFSKVVKGDLSMEIPKSAEVRSVRTVCELCANMRFRFIISACFNHGFVLFQCAVFHCALLQLFGARTSSTRSLGAEDVV